MANRRSGGIYVGPLSPDAGVATLIEALDLYPGARIDVVGNGSLTARLAEHPQIRLCGALRGDDLQAKLETASYLVLPSAAHDPMPRPVVEAFANGTPVIACSAADLIQPGRNGLLFEPGSARDLARRLAWAEAFPEKMRQMGECARADYQARFIQSYSYRTLFGERRRTARL